VLAQREARVRVPPPARGPRKRSADRGEQCAKAHCSPARIFKQSLSSVFLFPRDTITPGIEQKSSKQPNKLIENVRINSDIKAPEVRVLLDDGENAGVMKTDDALRLAEERELDLILISPKAKPPVARIMNFDKFRYERSKELKKQKAQKAPDTKRIQISPRTARNDLMVQLKKLEKFLSAGHRVEIQLTLRGREKGNKDWARTKLEEFMGMIETPHKVTSDIKSGGRGMLVQLTPE